MKSISIYLIILSTMTACSTYSCKIEDRKDVVMTGNEKVSSDNKDLTQRVFVFKPDGSRQCGQGEKIETVAMKRELGSINIYSMDNKHDGMMRPQVCGAPTGYSNVYEINLNDLDAALKLGFKKWIRD